MLEIDGSEGGGAVVRTAVGLAVATHTPVRVVNIRAERPNPGLQQQHLAGIRAAAELADAEIVGDEQDATTLTFVPNSLRLTEKIRVVIPTAGSVGLALQPLQIALVHSEKPVKVVVDGGATAGKWAPPTDYLGQVMMPMLTAMGYSQSIRVERHGFYPKGRALVKAIIGPSQMDEITLEERGDIIRIKGISRASEHLRQAEVAERQRSEARRVLKTTYPSLDIDIGLQYVDAASPGSVLSLYAISEDGHVIGANAVGEKGKRSESVGKEASEALLGQVAAETPVDEWFADQVIPLLAVSGGTVQVPRFTDHITQNIRVAKQFVDRDWDVDRKEGRIRVT